MANTCIVAIDDNREILISLRIVLGKHFDDVKCFPEPNQAAEAIIEEGKCDVVLLDMNFMPGETSGEEGLRFLEKVRKLDPTVSVVMMTAYGDIDLAVNAMKMGATDFVVKPWENKKLVATVLSSFKLTRSQRELVKVRDGQRIIASDADQPFANMIGDSEAMKQVYSTIEKVAGTDANVLILGENGTGKELVARAIHRKSARSDKLFISVDMGSIAENLFESELFGHVKGAFTDAKENRTGRFEVANGGTVFLDEIANIPLTLQAKLLTVIQNREVTRVGATSTKSIDVRLVFATNANIQELVESGTFRQDLYYRINTVEIHLPPLRERDDDIFLLTDYFLEHYAHKYGRSKLKLSKASYRLLKSYSWPGNVRELRHAIERAIILTEGDVIKPDSILLNTKDSQKSISNSSSLNIEDVEKKAIIQSLKLHKGNVSLAAKELGLGRTTLYRKMTKYGL
ncbi:MAG TPA: sigma-54 dependent transcriptional regulator [Tenuifilaceae bacterium]|nr:sigma-54 dependent transcriptional regulator [Tenuifilaceae bacterium]